METTAAAVDGWIGWCQESRAQTPAGVLKATFLTATVRRGQDLHTSRQQFLTMRNTHSDGSSMYSTIRLCCMGRKYTNVL